MALTNQNLASKYDTFFYVKCVKILTCEMYQGAAQVHLIFAGSSKKSEMFFIICLNVKDTKYIITIAKN